MINGSAGIRAPAPYAGVSRRTMRTWLKEGLKLSRLPSGMVLIKHRWIDEHLKSFQVSENQVDAIADEIISKMK